MKHLNTFLLIGISLPLFFLHSEDISSTEPLYQVAEETPLTALDEEISFFEEEFETELVSTADSVESPSIQLPSFSKTEAEVTQTLQEEALIQETPVARSDIESSESMESDDLKSIGLEPSLNEENSITSATLSIEEPSLIGEPAHLTSSGVAVDLKQAFSGAPIIYSILLAMSIFSVCLWLYSLASIRLSTRLSSSLIRQMQDNLSSSNFADALDLCNQNNTLFSKMLLTGIKSRKYGLPMVLESMKAEAKRSTVFFWQKLSLLNDIAVIAPMLGLLGTVLGMFYAFYDVNRSIESISTLFDGLGISVGTTVAGLIVAIVALILHSTAKYRLIRALAKVENEAQSMVTLLDQNTHS